MNPVNISILFFGTSEFACPALEALIKNGYKISAVITMPDKPAGRKQILTPPPVKVVAEKHGIPVLQPETLKSLFIQNNPSQPPLNLRGGANAFIPPLGLRGGEGELLPLVYDLFIVAAYGKLIPQSILDIPKFGTLNIHPSLLPKWRGPSPVQCTILNGDTEAGVSIMKIDELMDHGPIVAQRQLGISNFQTPISKAKYTELHDELSEMGAQLLIAVLPKYLSGEITPIAQDHTQSTFSHILKKDDGRIDWQQPAEKIERMIRAFNPWPGTWTLLPTESKILRLRIEEAEVRPEKFPNASPGYVWCSPENELQVNTGVGSLAIKNLTMEGKIPMKAKDFLRGYPSITGLTLV